MMNGICWRILAVLLLWSKTSDGWHSSSPKRERKTREGFALHTLFKRMGLVFLHLVNRPRKAVDYNYQTVNHMCDKRIVFEKIGISHKSLVPEKCPYDHALMVGDKIWVFGRRFVKQQRDWAVNVAYVGTYAIAFNTVTNKWEKAIRFPALSNEKNLDEKFFIHNGAPHVLLYRSFGEVSLKALYRWTGSSFKHVKLQSFYPIYSYSEMPGNVELQIADSQDDKTKYIIASMDNKMIVARLTFNRYGAKAKRLFDISAEEEDESDQEFMADSPSFQQRQATSAVVIGSRLLISYSGHTSHWTAESIIACNLNSRSCETLEINSKAKPRWSFTGAYGHALLPSGSWIHAAGPIRRGRSWAAFDGSIWELNNLKSNPTWKKLKAEIPKMEEGAEVVIDSRHKIIYFIGKTQIGKVKIA